MRTYDPAQIVGAFLGIPITGYAEDTFLMAERNEAAFTLKIGAGGEGARARNRNRSGLVTFTLLQSSPTNDLLSAAAILDEQFAEGVGPLIVKDMNGTTLLLAQNAWIRKIPTVEFAKEVGSREWVIECEALQVFTGGSNS